MWSLAVVGAAASDHISLAARNRSISLAARNRSRLGEEGGY
jgi:hypothetical protein